MNSTDQLPEESPRLLQAAREYLAELEAGRRPLRRDFANRFADLGDALSPYLDALDAVHGAAPLLQSSSAGRAIPATPEPLPAEPLGDFRIVRELGRGGMGVVYEAVQLSLGRHVALKVLPFAAALNATQLQRFKNEAQAAAQLHHANIVPVYGVGCERGVHFYAMQLIEGHNLATLIDHMRPAKGPPHPGAEPTGPYPPPPSSVGRGDTGGVPADRFSTLRTERANDYFRTAARLAAQAADALHYAHQMGIVHRDVKPANILLDGRGNAWVTDFGLAQFHADAALTQTGDLLGTVRYMSPEQAAGGRVLLDHRTDVYSLGATLYELLTQRPIFDGTDRQALLRQILHDDAKPPRAIDRAIPEELETIVLKSVSKAPTERYATAREMAEDLQRFLDFRPILARRATLAQRGRKWLRRHPSVAVAAVILLVLLAAGSLVSAWLIQAEQAKTEKALERERLRAEEAEARFQLARRGADEMIRVAEEELADKSFMQGVRKRLLEAALSYYGELLEQRRDDPESRVELDATRARVKKLLNDLAVLQGAGQLALLTENDVLDDLGLTEDQRSRVNELYSRLAEQRGKTFQAFHRLSSEERRSRFLELARENETAVASILTPGQTTRLKQIAMQLQGSFAFRDTEVAQRLKLTPEQRASIQALESGPPFLPGSFTGRGPGGRKGKPFGQGRKDGPDHQGWRDDTNRALSVLTEAQKKRWAEMTGQPFKGQVRFMRPPPPPGRH